MTRKTICIVMTAAAAVLAFCTPAFSQHDHEHHDHDIGHDAHGHGGPELGLSAAWVHLVDEDEDALGLHAHLTKRLAGEGTWALVSVGVGGEVIFAEAEHWVAAAVAGVNPWRALTLSFAPGVQWAKHGAEDEHAGDHEDEEDSGYETEFVMHLEATWAFPVGSGDLGPTIGWSKAGDEEHWGVGVHLGIHF